MLAPLDEGIFQVYPLLAELEVPTARLALIELAQSRVEIQVYLWRNDESRRGLVAAFWLAVSRGVRVCLFKPLALRHTRWLSGEC